MSIPFLPLKMIWQVVDFNLSAASFTFRIQFDNANQLVVFDKPGPL